MNQTSSFDSISLFDIRISTMSMQETVDYLTGVIERREPHQVVPHQVVTANPIIFMAALESEHYYDVMQAAELVVPDGTGVVWAANQLGTPIAERVAGFDLFHQLMEVGNKHAWKVYLLGTSPDVIQITAARLQERYPGIQLVGYRDGFFSDEEDTVVVQDIREKSPDLLFVARGLMTQEPWIGKYKHKLNVPVMMGVGGTFDIIAGKMKRAPQWLIRLRLEWLYRLVKQPTRILRMLALPRFVLRVRKHKRLTQRKRSM